MAVEFDLRLERRNFNIELSGKFPGGTTGIFGPSGAGKTSLFSMLCGLEKKVRGRVSLNGRILTDSSRGIHLPPNKRRIGMVFQEKRLFPHLSVRENILFGERYSKKKSTDFDRAVEFLELGRLLDSMPEFISGGEQQRTAIARALMTSPELLLLDEPFSAVDGRLRSSIIPYLQGLGSEFGIPMLVISHELADIQRLTDRIYLIESGRCRGFGNIVELFSKGNSGINDEGMVNSFRLNHPAAVDEGLYSSRAEGISGVEIRTAFAPSGSFTAIVKPEDIAVSLNRLHGTSIQNQIPGRIKRIINRKGRVYCIVDAGVEIVSLISSGSLKTLELREGDSVFCLFKAHALTI